MILASLFGCAVFQVAIQPGQAFESLATRGACWGSTQRARLESSKNLLSFSVNLSNPQESSSAAKHEWEEQPTRSQAAPRSASSAARLLLSASLVTQDWMAAVVATEEFAMESLYCAQALLFTDITAVSTDLTDHYHAASLKTNLMILLQRILSITTFQMLIRQINLDGNLIFESVMLQVGVSEVFRRLRTQYMTFESDAPPRKNTEHPAGQRGIRKRHQPVYDSTVRRLHVAKTEGSLQH